MQIKKFTDFILNEKKEEDKSKPEYYLNSDTYYNPEQKEKFKFWYHKIKPFLDKNDEYGALEILIDWDEECLPKFDIYSMVRQYFKK